MALLHFGRNLLFGLLRTNHESREKYVPALSDSNDQKAHQINV
jgi:hypothetical protein